MDCHWKDNKCFTSTLLLSPTIARWNNTRENGGKWFQLKLGSDGSGSTCFVLRDGETKTFSITNIYLFKNFRSGGIESHLMHLKQVFLMNTWKPFEKNIWAEKIRKEFFSSASSQLNIHQIRFTSGKFREKSRAKCFCRRLRKMWIFQVQTHLQGFMCCLLFGIFNFTIKLLLLTWNLKLNIKLFTVDVFIFINGTLRGEGEYFY